jgi:hypothetical protein
MKCASGREVEGISSSPSRFAEGCEKVLDLSMEARRGAPPALLAAAAARVGLSEREDEEMEEEDGAAARSSADPGDTERFLLRVAATPAADEDPLARPFFHCVEFYHYKSI